MDLGFVYPVCIKDLVQIQKVYPEDYCSVVVIKFSNKKKTNICWFFASWGFEGKSLCLFCVVAFCCFAVHLWFLMQLYFQ